MVKTGSQEHNLYNVMHLKAKKRATTAKLIGYRKPA